MAKTIVIVDDVAFVRKTLTTLLSNANYQVIGEASNGEDASKLFESLKPDLITMDMVMPGISGIEATRKIMSFDKKAKVIIISALNQENIIMEAINAGAKDYIIKPFSAQDILKAVERALLGDEYVLGRTVQSREAS